MPVPNLDASSNHDPSRQRSGSRSLVAYVVPSDGQPPTTTQLDAHLRGLLPSYMIPSAYVSLAELPLTPNGKLDRDALPAPCIASDNAGRAPRNDRERALCAAFADILDVADITIDTDFLLLGADSIQVMRLVSRLRSMLAVEISARDVFEAPTVAKLAGRISSAPQARPALRSSTRPARIPLSPAQARMWFLDQLHGPTALYNTPLFVRLRGQVDLDALELAVNDVIARHEILRTRYRQDLSGPYQEILPAGLHTVTLQRLTCAESELTNLLKELGEQPFRLSTAPPLRAALIRLDSSDWVLALSMHHIVTDGWSTAPMLADLSIAYEARLLQRAPAWTPLTLQYADYALWQQQLDMSGAFADQLDQWTAWLSDVPAEPMLKTRPHDGAGPADGATIEFRIDPDVHEQLIAVARRTSSTLFMVLQTALLPVLRSLGAGDDIATGTAVAGRSDEALAPLIGLFVNTLVLRTDVSGDPTLAELLERVRTTTLAAFDNQDVPFDRVVERVNPSRESGRHPLFQTMLALHNMPRRRQGGFGGLEVEQLTTERRTAKFDLDLQFVENFDRDGRAGGLIGRLEYATAILDASDADLVVQRFVTVLAAMASRPDQRISELAVAQPLDQDCGADAVTAAECPAAAAAAEGEDVGDASAADVESQLCNLMGEVLGVPDVCSDDDFFALGGHSLLAIRFVAHVRAQLGLDLPVKAVFDNPTPSSLAKAAETVARTHGDRPALTRQS